MISFFKINEQCSNIFSVVTVSVLQETISPSLHGTWQFLMDAVTTVHPPPCLE